MMKKNLYCILANSNKAKVYTMMFLQIQTYNLEDAYLGATYIYQVSWKDEGLIG